MTVTYTNSTGAPGGAATISATDTTTVIAGHIGLLKEQALDPTCTNTIVGAFVVTDIVNSQAVPGACVRYRITVTNKGTVNVANVVVNDATPFNTVYNTGSQCFPAPGAPGAAGLASSQGTVDICWTMSTDERETQILPIRIPIDKGLIGWRIALHFTSAIRSKSRPTEIDR